MVLGVAHTLPNIKTLKEEFVFQLENERRHYQRQELMSILIIECGIRFPSIFIGMSLALTTGDEFTALLTAIVFHQV